jgi:hypothetical protein
VRLAVAQIAAEHGKHLQREEALLNLLHGGGDFVVDFYMALRITSCFERVAACSMNRKLKTPRTNLWFPESVSIRVGFLHSHPNR